MDDAKALRAWVLGGDGRTRYLTEQLREEGLPVKTWAVPGLPDQAGSLTEALRGADLVILPLKPFLGETLTLGGETLAGALLPEYLAKDATVITGQLPEALEEWYSQRGLRLGLLLEDEAFQMENAAITAEGAVYVALRELRGTLRGSRARIMGWGRIGRHLARDLRALGTAVTVAARNPVARAEIESLGLTAVSLEEPWTAPEKLDLLVNTVPAPVISPENLRSLREDCVLLELAGAPGGFPKQEPGEDRVIMARGLPAITAPKQAGAAMARAVWRCLAGAGRCLE